jgi:general secretion pathway protein L
MADWFILRMPRSADATATWLIADAEGRPLAPVQGGSLEEAGGATTGRRVAVLVPATDVLNLEVELPVRAGARAAQLVPFALEEQLATDVDTQHFAIAAAAVAGRTAVAVVTRSLMDDWLARLTSAGIAPELLCADAALMPHMVGHAVALLEGDTLSFSDGEDDARLTLSAPPGGLANALVIAFGEELPGTELLLHASPPDWQRRSAEVEAARPLLAELKVQLLGSGALPWLAAQLPGARPINLLQGAYARRTSLGAGWARWRVAAAFAAALLLLHAGSQLFSLWHLGRSARELDGAIAALAGPLVPTGTESVRRVLEPRLLEARAQGGRSGLLAALQVLSRAMTGVPGARIHALDFRDGALQLRVRAGDAQSLDRINQSLRAAGWQAQLTSGGADGDAYEGSIQLRGGGS